MCNIANLLGKQLVRTSPAKRLDYRFWCGRLSPPRRPDPVEDNPTPQWEPGAGERQSPAKQPRTLRGLQVPQDVEGADDANQDTVVIDHEQVMNLEGQEVGQHAADRGVHRHR